MDHNQQIQEFVSSPAIISDFLVKNNTGILFGFSFLVVIMHAATSLLLLGVTGLQSVLGLPHRTTKRADIDAFITTQEPIALEGVLCNIGANGCEASDAPPGIVVASPSRSNPDCEPIKCPCKYSQLQILIFITV